MKLTLNKNNNKTTDENEPCTTQYTFNWEQTLFKILLSMIFYFNLKIN